MSEMNPTSWLTDQFLDYVDDANHRYAVVLEGEWGSGKTHYLETVLAPALKKHGKTLIRVSLFGVKDSRDLYEKLVAALLHLSEDDKGKKKAALRGAVSQIPALFSTLTNLVGVPINLNANAKTVIDLLIGEKHVVAFDDTERRAEDADDLSLFGAINDLVEGKNAKVILVTNGADSGNSNQRGFDRDIREKLVWKIFPYKPSSNDLVNDIFGSHDFGNTTIDRLECIQSAAVLASCNNVRSMLRAEPFIKDICSISALERESIAESTRQRALIDAIHFALLRCKGVDLKGEITYEEKAGLTPEYMVYLGKKELREKYADFACIEEYFDPRSVTSEINLEEGFLSYVERRYPDSPDTVEFLEIKDALANFHELSDGEMAPIIARLTSSIRKAKYSPSLIRDAVSWNCQLADLGFDNLLSQEELTNCCKQTIDNDPAKAQAFFKNGAFLFSPATEEIETILATLRDHSDKAYLERIKLDNSMEIDLSQANCGINLACRMDETWKKDAGHILDYQPKTIVAAFLASDGRGQNEIRNVFICMRSYFFSFMVDGDFANWLEGIKQLLIDSADCEHMTDLRKNWFISNIDDLLSQVSQRAESSRDS
ncbi:P-loop NTPase fold protein [Atopobium fossor]|uniref:P-loop NTPase fold protein n=1 Tax=Atopobium fossor TaxID=39487 RepID=UPI00041FF073|nr:P-loop NTPase fold protein [Atopobium fossor]